MTSTTISRLALATLGLGGLAATTAFGPPAKPNPPQKGVGINLANIDTSVQPCEDFYHYANGSWLKNNPVPAAEDLGAASCETGETASTSPYFFFFLKVSTVALIAPSCDCL